jgi:hypothetical protein
MINFTVFCESIKHWVLGNLYTAHIVLVPGLNTFDIMILDQVAAALAKQLHKWEATEIYDASKKGVDHSGLYFS